MSSPFFSIIIPVYNAESYLKKCLDSWENQSFKDYEVIIVDDGSSDRSLTICESYTERLVQFRLIKKENSGVSEARNMGLAIARGEFIGFCDADDFVSKDLLSDVFKNIMCTGCDILVFHVSDAKKEVDSKFKVSSVINVRSHEWLCLHTLRDERIKGSVWNKYIRRSFITEQFNPKLTHLEDCEWILRILADNPNAKICESESVLYAYIYRGDSVTKARDKYFNEKGVFRYIASLQAMQTIQGLTKKTYREIVALLYSFSIDNLFLNKVQEESQKELLFNIKKGRLLFFFSNCINFKTKVKYAIKEMIIINERKRSQMNSQ